MAICTISNTTRATSCLFTPSIPAFSLICRPKHSATFHPFSHSQKCLLRSSLQPLALRSPTLRPLAQARALAPSPLPCCLVVLYQGFTGPALAASHPQASRTKYWQCRVSRSGDWYRGLAIRFSRLRPIVSPPSHLSYRASLVQHCLRQTIASRCTCSNSGGGGPLVWVEFQPYCTNQRVPPRKSQHCCNTTGRSIAWTHLDLRLIRQLSGSLVE